MESPEDTDAYKAGEMARAKDISMDECPYPQGAGVMELNEDRYYWMSGWLAADKDAK